MYDAVSSTHGPYVSVTYLVARQPKQQKDHNQECEEEFNYDDFQSKRSLKGLCVASTKSSAEQKNLY